MGRFNARGIQDGVISIYGSDGNIVATLDPVKIRIRSWGQPDDPMCESDVPAEVFEDMLEGCA